MEVPAFGFALTMISDFTSDLTLAGAGGCAVSQGGGFPSGSGGRSCGGYPAGCLGTNLGAGAFALD